MMGTNSWKRRSNEGGGRPQAEESSEVLTDHPKQCLP
jgi:hypothetical protein